MVSVEFVPERYLYQKIFPYRIGHVQFQGPFDRVEEMNSVSIALFIMLNTETGCET